MVRNELEKSKNHFNGNAILLYNYILQIKINKMLDTQTSI